MDYVEALEIISAMPDDPENTRPPMPEKNFEYNFPNAEHSIDSEPDTGSSESSDGGEAQSGSSSSSISEGEGQEEEKEAGDDEINDEHVDIESQDVPVDNPNESANVDVHIR